MAPKIEAKQPSPREQACYEVFLFKKVGVWNNTFLKITTSHCFLWTLVQPSSQSEHPIFRVVFNLNAWCPGMFLKCLLWISRSCQEHQIGETLERTPESLFPKQGASWVGRTGRRQAGGYCSPDWGIEAFFPDSQKLTYHSRMDGIGNSPGIAFAMPFVNAKHLTAHICFNVQRKLFFI